MAELKKKMNFKNASGVTTQAKLYSTKSEAGAEYQTLKVDGVTAYVSVGATSDSNATSGRFKKSGTTKAYLKRGGTPYTEMSWTTPGTYTWTCPSGVTKVKVAVIAGGAAYDESSNANEGYSGRSATHSKFDTLEATTAYIETMNSGGTQLVPGAPNGRLGPKSVPKYTAGVPTIIPGAKGFGLDFDINSVGSYGEGGDITIISAFDDDDNNAEMEGQPSGGKNVGYLTVVPNKTYTVVVGQGTYYFINYYGGLITMESIGGDGAVLIAYGGDMK